MEQEINSLLNSLVSISKSASLPVKQGIAAAVQNACHFASSKTLHLYSSAMLNIEIKPHRDLIVQVQNELERLVLLAFGKLYERNDEMINLAYINGLEWIEDRHTFRSVGFEVNARAEYTDSGWRTRVKFEYVSSHDVVPECIREFSFDVDSCADDHFRKENNIETFKNDLYGVTLPRDVIQNITEQEACMVLEWLKSYFMYLRCTEA